jgi:hypothetical protein
MLIFDNLRSGGALRWKVEDCRLGRSGSVMWQAGTSKIVTVVSLNPPMGVDRQYESREAQSLYPSALQLARALRFEFVGYAT